MAKRADLDSQALAGEGVWAAPAAHLSKGIEALGLSISAEAQANMLAYLALLAKWSKTYNLTAVTDPMAMVDRHLIDSLSMMPWVPRGFIVDAGTGAGLPGLVLALAGAGERWALVDSNGKKIRFLRQVCRSLALTSVEPIQGRLETVSFDACPEAIVARALAPLERLVEWANPWLDQGTVLMAMKADLQESEILGVSPSYNVSIKRLNTTDPTVTRCLALVGHAEAVKRLDNES